jgi:hypothetical protein
MYMSHPIVCIEVFFYLDSILFRKWALDLACNLIVCVRKLMNNKFDANTNVVFFVYPRFAIR